ncbi:hypothetical protein [Streptomyces sp. SID8499]|uniref:hypothetical protein n=1 Tax=Streptomyces sp. SID8499 TaxID=2706106 RepID=UPI0013C56D7B|nr:hypothetical protein [Streptomyces sp. SID8499]NED31973.1 hypothetical protein [Streptomyces sp. SID8499]
MAAISVGSVEVDVIPSTRGIYQRLRDGLVPDATRAGADAGDAAGNAFAPAMRAAIGDTVGARIGQQIGQQIAASISAQVRDSLRDGVTQGGRLARPAAARQGDDSGGAFGRAFRARLQAAMQSLPRADVRLSDTGFNADMARLRARLETLANKRIGVDVDAATAMAEVDRLEAELRRLGAQHPDVQVRMDTGAALAQLAALRAAINGVDGEDVDVDTRSAAAGFNALTAAAIAFGPAIIPVLPIVAAGLGLVAAAGVAAAAGIGGIAAVAVPAFKQIGTVLQAQKAAQDAAAQATANGAQAAQQAASRASQLAAAQQAVASAERNGARQIAQAQAQVSQARQAAAQAAAQASLRSQQAARAVEDAERSLADAQRAAKQAQADLTAARQQAAQQLEDLNNRLTDSQLSQRDAEIALKEATAQRDQVLKAANSTELDKQKALLAYDQAVQRLKEQTTETARLKDETAAANKAGVDGSKTVLDAQDKVAAAQQQVADRTRALKDAQADQARTAQENAQQIAQAQQRIADAQGNVAQAQQQAADSAASAARQLQQAQMSTVSSASSAETAQAKYREELAKLTPAARQTMNAYTGLKGAFNTWSRSLQPKVMPIFTRALDGIRKMLPTLTPFVVAAADAVSELQDRFSKQIKSPFWQRFKDDLQKSVKPAIIGLGVAFGNVITGMAGIIGAFLPHVGSFSDSLEKATGKFADWGKNLKGSPAFENFLSFAADKAPLVASAIGQIVMAVVNIGRALAPISTPVIGFITGLAQGVSWVATNMPWLIQGVYGVVVAMNVWKLAVAGWALAQRAANIAMTAFNLISKAGPWGWIALAIAAVVVAVVLMYNKVDWFRAAVQAVWSGLKRAASAVVDWFKGPFTRFFTVTIPGVFNTVLSWVKRNWPWILGALTGPIGLAVVAIIKYWGDIKHGFSSAWSWIKSNVLYPIRDFFTKTIPGWGNTLAAHMVGAFDNARSGIKTAWDKIKDIARKPVQFVVDTVYNNGIRKVWNLVTDAFGGKHLEPMKFATGGILPGYTPGKDVHLAALSGGEAIMRPEWTRAVGPGYVHAMNAAARTGGVTGVQQALGLPAFKDGGIFSGIGDVVSGAWDKVKKGASWLKDSFSGALKAGVEHVVNPLVNKIPGGGIGFVGLLKDLMKGAVARLVGAGKTGDEKASPNVNYKAGAGVEQWRPVVLQSLREVGEPASLAGSTLRRMNQESGGNPTIVNKWDSNWQRGTPSVGLMQVIGPTFRSYAGKYRGKGPFLYGVSVDPLANIYSSMRYAMGAYGSLSRAYDRPGGYDSGGWMPPGMNLMYNGLGQPEAVLTPGQWNAIHGAATRGGDGASIGDLSVNVYVGNEKITDIARTEILNAQGELIQVLNAS